jgi:hypothetical protein
MRHVIKARRAVFVRRADLVGVDSRSRDLKASELVDRDKKWRAAEIDENWYLTPKRRSPPARR